MYELDIPQGANLSLDGDFVVISGKLGTARKKINRKLMSVSIEGGRVVIKEKGGKKLEKFAALAIQSFSSGVKSAMEGVTKGIEVKMKVVYAHFPMSIEIKGRDIVIKNIFGEKIPRVTHTVGDTKVEVKGQDVTVRGVDNYDVGQTVANMRKACAARGYDTRVFQDGIYVALEE
jgi:large subunit ribosomal protein L6